MNITETLDTVITKTNTEQLRQTSQKKDLNNAIFTKYGLKAVPFKDAADPHFFFQTKQHERAFMKIMLSIENDISLVMLSGPSGTGKTMVSEVVLKNLDETKYHSTLILVSPGMSRSSLLEEVATELGLIAFNQKEQQKQRLTYYKLLRQIQEHIMKLYAEGKKLILLLDEAHFLTKDNLHILRTLSNIETDKKKLVTCILVGEEQLWKRVQHPSFASVSNRTYQKISLTPLSEKDTDQYIKFRISIAGGNPRLFTSKAIQMIHKASKGICRHINKISFNSIVEAFISKQPYIDDATVKLAIDSEK